MKAMTRLALALMLVGLLYALPSVASSAQESTIVALKVQQTVSFLFVLSAKTGVITKFDDGYTLTLQGMDDKVLYFSDRPVRQSGFITVTQFMKDWVTGNNSFAVNPPNAAIIHAALKTDAKGLAQAIAVELTSPVAIANGWKFALKDLQGSISVGTYDEITVFVDNGSIHLNGTRGGIIGHTF